MKTLARLLVVLAAAVVAPVAHADVQDPPDRYYSTDGAVADIDLDGEHLLLGGSFKRIGRRTGPMVAVDTATGEIDPRLPEFQSGQGSAASDGSGGWYLPRPGLEDRVGRFAGGGWDPGFDVELDGPVSALERVGDVLYIGGAFTEAGGAERRGAAAVDARTGALLPWVAAPGLTGGRAVSAFRALGGRLYLLGSFPAASGAEADVVAVDASTGAALDFRLDVDGLPFDVEVAGDRLFVAGAFTGAGGAEREGVAEVDPETGETRPFDAGLGYGTVLDLALDAPRGVLYAAGGFKQARGEPRGGFAAVDLTTGALLPWNPRPGGTAPPGPQVGSAVAVAGDRVVVSGRDPTPVVAAVDRVTGGQRTWSMRPNADVGALVAADGQVVVSGSFGMAATVPRRGLARIRASDGAPAGAPLPGIRGGSVLAMDRRGDALYLAGTFTHVGGQPRGGLAAVDARTGAVLPWAPEVEGSPWTLVAGPDAIFVGGYFYDVAGVDQAGLAALDPETGAALPGWEVGRGVLGVTDLEISRGRLFVAGDFETAQGEPRAGLASLDATTGALDPWRPEPDARVDGLAVDGDRVYLGGRFTSVGGEPRANAAAVDAVDGATLDWAPEVRGPVGPILVAGERVYLAGPRVREFDEPGRDVLTLVDRATGAPLQPLRLDGPGGPGTRVDDLVADGNRVFVGGWLTPLFSTPGSLGRPVNAGGLAAFTVRPLNVAPPTVSGDREVGATLTCDPGSWRDAEGEFAYEWHRFGAPAPVGTGPTYVATEEDTRSGGVRCVVTAARADQRTQAESRWVSIGPATSRPPAAPRDAKPIPAPPAGRSPERAAPPATRVRLRAKIVRRSPRRLTLRLRCRADCRVRVRVTARRGRRCASRTYRVRGGVARTVRIKLRAGGGCRRSGRRVTTRLR